jgi:hypothetical protein
MAKPKQPSFYTMSASVFQQASVIAADTAMEALIAWAEAHQASGLAVAVPVDQVTQAKVTTVPQPSATAQAVG